MIHGDKVGECKVNIDHEHVKILRENRLSNPNYVVLYLEILKSDKAFDFDITFSKDGKLYEEYTYHLLKRDKTNRRSTFNTSDVINLSVKGDNWGLCCNSVHYFNFLFWGKSFLTILPIPIMHCLPIFILFFNIEPLPINVFFLIFTFPFTIAPVDI